jgi:hypothetical protein
MMRRPPLQLDFRRVPVSRWRWVGWAALSVAVAVAAAVADIYAESESRYDAARTRMDRLLDQERLAVPRHYAPATDPLLLAELRSANAIVDQLTVPWGELFDAIEAADARGIGLLALIPNARDHSVRLSGEALTIDEVLGYTERLAARPQLSRVHLLGYSTVQRDGVSAFSFTLAATWRQMR